MTFPMPENLSLSAADDTKQSQGGLGSVAVSPGGINLGEIMQNFSQPYEHGGAAAYPQSRLFDTLFGITPDTGISKNFTASSVGATTASPLVTFGIPIAAVLGVLALYKLGGG